MHEFWSNAYNFGEGEKNMATLQEILRKRGRAPTAVEGEQFMPIGRPGYGTGARQLMPSRVVAGTQSNGMTGGGAIGSALMMSGAAVPGTAMGGVPQQQPRQMRAAGPDRLVYRGEVVGEAANPENAKQLRQAFRTPTTKSNADVAATAQQARRDAMAPRRDAVIERGKVRGAARDERMQFARDREQFGERGALVRAFQRQGVDPTRAMAMMQGNMQWLSEDNRQQRAATEASARTGVESERNAIDRDRLTAEIDQGREQAELPWIQAGQAAYDQAIAAGQTHSQAVLAGQTASNGLWTGSTAMKPKPKSPQTAGVPQRIIDEARAAGNTAQADEMEEQNRRLEEARRRTGMGGLRGLWDDWWNFK